ncbi:STAS domain-containing protein [Solwaraspora sp. WMMD937]|uniref:STAS domain-containing protein n=1 Tax=Solwaraspora sp. WMMD937 TaxID=3016090 RepID=UPI00249CDBDF|nr:STAS domain-containing protein [Solwaraspora sp. WMMD937]WFE20333.1 STAS domain-containing protein [Solwaraspora sp. WMMD937]
MDFVITRSYQGTTVRLALHGELDLATAGEVRDAVTALLARSAPERIVLDLTCVSFIDSTGIGSLVACHQAAGVSGSRLELENISSFTRRQLWATGLLGLFGFPADDTTPSDLPVGR